MHDKVNATRGGAGVGLLNKETRKAEAKPLHGFMDSLLKPKTARTE